MVRNYEAVFKLKLMRKAILSSKKGEPLELVKLKLRMLIKVNH